MENELIRPLDWTDAWGYHHVDHFDQIYPNNQLRKLHLAVKVLNFSNGASYLLSPLVGLIRIVVSVGLLILLNYQNDPKARKRLKSEYSFLYMEIGRGTVEFFSLGIVFLVVDIYATQNRYPPWSTEY